MSPNVIRREAFVCAGWACTPFTLSVSSSNRSIHHRVESARAPSAA
jgi:hypothetical protein